jgi:hypothetical protein
MIQLTYLNFNRAKRLSYITLYDLYGLKIYDPDASGRGTILKLQDVPLFRGARGVLVDLGYTKYDLGGFI